MYSIIAVTANSSCTISNIQFIILYFVIYLQQDYNKCKTYVWCACKSTYRDWLRNCDLCVCDSPSYMILLLSHIMYAGSAPCSQSGTRLGPVVGSSTSCRLDSNDGCANLGCVELSASSSICWFFHRKNYTCYRKSINCDLCQHRLILVFL